MQHDPSDRQVHLVPAKVVSRRTIVALTAKLVGGAALSVVAGLFVILRMVKIDV